MEKIEIGYTVEKERWLEASENLHEFGQIMARNLRNMNRDGCGQEAADDLMADIMLACAAIGYVAVLLSIKPEWWEKILAGEKDLEIRKTVPRGGAGEPEPWPLLVLAYVSGTGAVLGQFLCMGWVKSNCWRYLSSRSCVPEEDLKKYAGGKSLYGWIVGEAEAYDTPSPLAEFGLNRPPMSWQYVEIPDPEDE